MLINTTSLLNSFGKITKNKTRKNEMAEKISSGKRINVAADDAAGLCISESFKAQVRGISAAERSIQDGISLLQVVDGALDEIGNTLQRMKEVSIESSNGTYSKEDREALDKEFQQLKNHIQNISENTEFNTMKVLNSNKEIVIQTKDNPYASYSINLYKVELSELGLKDVSINDMASSIESLGKVDTAIDKIINIRVNIASDMNNLKSCYNDAANAEENLTSSLSGIKDLDIASSYMKMVKDNILVDYSKSMIVATKQRNESANTVLNKWINS